MLRLTASATGNFHREGDGIRSLGFDSLGASSVRPASPQVPVWRVRKIVGWRCQLQGRAPEKAWANSEVLSFNLLGSWTPYCVKGPQLRASDICRDRLTSLTRAIEQFPVSYNKMLLQGAADYCIRVLSKIDEAADDQRCLLNRIRRFASQAAALRSQYSGNYVRSFALLDLQLIEDQFEMVQAESARLGILPRLSDIPTSELVEY